jgi:hypothetical protein
MGYAWFGHCVRRSGCNSPWSHPPHRHRRGCGPLTALLAPLFAAFDALLGAVGGDVGRCLHVTTWGHLTAGGVLSGDAARLLRRVPEEVAMSVTEPPQK